ncbi:cytochrome P450 [Sandaracinobacteroides saxicola]|uniref:Cytochrome P450 n=1 Tax=Sandaracinobacteroides saxicola TaxID=2759707 RepID=A0A7G5IL63_9SPHN|nr:cytochrome P450 [Sandaracinobacteroides saxicola]QMW24105.1 cytochrome P450 [Sandaracinobacteroides saxicola]
MNAPVPASEFLLATLPNPTLADLSHIPGPPPAKIRALRTIKFLKDPLGTIQLMADTYGLVFKRQDFGGWGVTMLGPDANELVMFNKDKIFSSAGGWNPVLDQVFPKGLMLMDFEEHRMHRKTLSVAFKPAPMKHYLGELNAGIARRLARWEGQGEFKFYPAIKDLTLDLAATSFLGIPWGPEARRINQAFVDMVLASVGIARKPWPFTQMRRGVEGRAFLCDYFGKLIPQRRGQQGDDIFTQVCNARDENEQLLSDQAIIDHMNFLMMAAHDTTTSSITSLTWFLARHPEWQEQIRAEIDGVRARHGDTLPYEALGELELLEMAFKEALRLIPPVPAMPRRAVKAFDFLGYHIPAGAQVGINPMFTHRMPEHWPDPEKFDPMRFTTQLSRDRHKYAWVPFGGGAHMCLGLHFAYMQVKSFFFQLLSTRRITVPSGYECQFSMFPIPKPRDGLPIRLLPR